jgi:hypothetical protein
LVRSLFFFECYFIHLSFIIDTEGLDDEVRPGSNNTRGRSTKFCMLKQNGDYADSYYCNVYHNCHGGFDTIQYCTRGLVSYIRVFNFNSELSIGSFIALSFRSGDKKLSF